MRISFALAIMIVFVTSGGARADRRCPKVTQADTEIGRVFVDEDGMTLYTYRGDDRYRPRCLGSCSAAWPPLAGTELSACDENNSDWSIITRSDGQSQWALDGRPLYRSVKDAAPGEITIAGPAWAPANVPCPAAKSRFGILREEEAYAVIGTAIANGVEPIGALRQWCGIGVYDLAARANISASEIKAHESGRRDLSRTARMAIAQALGAPVYLLLE